MWRHIALWSLLGLALVPDWASAFGFRRLGLFQRRGGILNRQACSSPVVFTPIRAYCPPPVYVYPACPPVQYSIVPTVPSVPSTPANPPSTSNTMKPPMVEAIPNTPGPKAPEVKPVEGIVVPERKSPEIRIDPMPPMPGIPVKEKEPEGIKPPSAPLPMNKKDQNPEPVFPKVPMLDAPNFKPASNPEEGLKLPPLIPQVPGATNLPPLSVPGLEDAPRTSKSSPLTSRPPVNVYFVDGDVPPSPESLRKVNFYNHTELDVVLTVQGKLVKLPKRSYLELELPSQFNWKLDSYPEQKTELPLASSGAEVVIRRTGL